jgi:hypothetical protein
MREVARLPKAFTVKPFVADVQLEVAGAFKSMPDALAASLKAGDRFPAIGTAIAEVVSVGTPVPGELRLRVGDDMVRVASAGRDLPATLRVQCRSVRGPGGSARCMVPGGDEPVAIAPDALLALPAPQGPLLFQIATAHAPAANAADAR